MDTAILVALITGGFSVIGVVISNMSSNKKIESALTTSQAVTDTKIEELTREVREHNDFARRVPLLEQQIEHLESRIEKVERKVEA